MELKMQTARKEHRCDACGRRIPVGAKYWRGHVTLDEHLKSGEVGFREHVSCAEFKDEVMLDAGFNCNEPKPARGCKCKTE